MTPETRTARRAYARLLALYPRRFRETYGPEMLQTFTDHYQDHYQDHYHDATGGQLRFWLTFWLGTVTDELGNVADQHRQAILARHPVLTPNRGNGVCALLLVPPLFFLFLASLIRLALALPHPPVGGIGFPLALGALLLLSAAGAAVSGYVLASLAAQVALQVVQTVRAGRGRIGPAR